jgi:hypothetical protein
MAEPGFSNRNIGGTQKMIGKGHPDSKDNAKELRKRGDDLFYATDSNLLFVRDGAR